MLLIFGGMDTTRNQLGLAMQTFLGHPDQWAPPRRAARAGPAGGRGGDAGQPDDHLGHPGGLEDLEFEGLESPRAPRCTCSPAPPAPTRALPRPPFDITAEERPRHFGFGGGIHHCIGHFVARSDMSEALPLLASRLRTRASMARPARCRHRQHRPVELPIAFDP